MSRSAESDSWLDAPEVRADLPTLTARGGAYALSAQANRFLLQLGSIVVFARLLVPADFGLVAMVTSATGFLVLIRDIGLSSAVVQAGELEQRQASALFWILFGASAALGMIVLGLAVPIARFFGNPALVLIAQALSFGVFAGGLGAMHRSILQRRMRFGAIAIIDLVALAGGVSAGIALALAGVGYWALVCMSITNSVLASAGCWLACDWRPGAPGRACDVRSLIGFGGYLTGFNLLNYGARSIDDVLVGKFASAVRLGLYAKAYELLMLPIRLIAAPVSPVFVAALSRLKDDPDRYRHYYRQGLHVVSALGMPVVVFALVAASDLVLAVLGTKWIGMVPLFRALGPAAFLGTFGVATGWVYLSLGRTRRQFRWALIGVPIVVAGFTVGIRWGAYGVAVSYSVTQLFLRLPALRFCFAGTPVSLSDVATAVTRPVASALLAGGVTLALATIFPGAWGPWPRLLVQGCGYLLAYPAVWFLLPGGRASLVRLLRTSKWLRGRKSENR